MEKIYQISTAVRVDLSSLLYKGRLAFLPTSHSRRCSSLRISREYEEAAWGYHLLSFSVCTFLVESLFHFVNRISYSFFVNFVAVNLYYKTAYRPTPEWGWNCVAAYIILSWACRLAVEEGTLNMLPSSKIVPALKHHTVKTRLGTAVYFQPFQLYLTLALS